jgi:transcription elongation factor GreA-like protein
MVLAVLIPMVSAAQQSAEDSVAYQQAVDHTIALYVSQVGDQSRLFNGRHYDAYPYSFKEGTPYLDSLVFRHGAVLYDSIWYPDIPLVFDVLGQKLITKQSDRDLQLLNERIGAFTVGGHQFIQIKTDNLSKSWFKVYFYEVLYPGKSMVLRKYYKSLREEPTTTEGILRYIYDNNDYFIKTGADFSRANTRRELLDIFSDHKKEIQRFIRKNKLKFRQHKEELLTLTAAYYDQLKH